MSNRRFRPQNKRGQRRTFRACVFRARVPKAGTKSSPALVENRFRFHRQSRKQCKQNAVCAITTGRGVKTGVLRIKQTGKRSLHFGKYRFFSYKSFRTKLFKTRTFRFIIIFLNASWGVFYACTGLRGTTNRKTCLPINSFVLYEKKINIFAWRVLSTAKTSWK